MQLTDFDFGDNDFCILCVTRGLWLSEVDDLRFMCVQMATIVDVFRDSPSEELLSSCTKEQLLQIAESYKVEVAPRHRVLKETM